MKKVSIQLINSPQIIGFSENEIGRDEYNKLVSWLKDPTTINHTINISERQKETIFSNALVRFDEIDY